MKIKIKVFLVALFLFCGCSSFLYAQHISVSFDGPLYDPASPTQELPLGSAILVMIATDGMTAGTDVNNAYLAGSGDVVAKAAAGFFHPSQYNDTAFLNGYGMSFPTEQLISLDVSDYAKDDVVQVFVRIINNIAGSGYPGIGLPDSGFDATGNTIALINGADPASYQDTYYVDSAIQSFTVNPDDTIGTTLTFSFDNLDANVIGDWSEDGAAPNIWTPVTPQAVPEPGAMMLMASGMLLLVRKIKK